MLCQNQSVDWIKMIMVILGEVLGHLPAPPTPDQEPSLDAV